MKSFSIPALSALKSTDAIAIRQIVSSLVSEIDKLNKRFDDMEEMNKKSRETRRDRKYGV